MPYMHRGLDHFFEEAAAAGPLQYPPELYRFLFEVIFQASTAEKLSASSGAAFHLSPAKICSLFAGRMRREFGPFSNFVLEAWRVKSSEDIGKAVMEMAQRGSLRLSGQETIEDFKQAGLEA